VPLHETRIDEKPRGGVPDERLAAAAEEKIDADAHVGSEERSTGEPLVTKLALRIEGRLRERRRDAQSPRFSMRPRRALERRRVLGCDEALSFVPRCASRCESRPSFARMELKRGEL
jgi:hypothetical protein